MINVARYGALLLPILSFVKLKGSHPWMVQNAKDQVPLKDMNASKVSVFSQVIHVVHQLMAVGHPGVLCPIVPLLVVLVSKHVFDNATTLRMASKWWCYMRWR